MRSIVTAALFMTAALACDNQTNTTTNALATKLSGPMIDANSNCTNQTVIFSRDGWTFHDVDTAVPFAVDTVGSIAATGKNHLIGFDDKAPRTHPALDTARMPNAPKNECDDHPPTDDELVASLASLISPSEHITWKGVNEHTPNAELFEFTEGAIVSVAKNDNAGVHKLNKNGSVVDAPMECTENVGASKTENVRQLGKNGVAVGSPKHAPAANAGAVKVEKTECSEKSNEASDLIPVVSVSGEIMLLSPKFVVPVVGIDGRILYVSKDSLRAPKSAAELKQTTDRYVKKSKAQKIKSTRTKYGKSWATGSNSTHGNSTIAPTNASNITSTPPPTVTVTSAPTATPVTTAPVTTAPVTTAPVTTAPVTTTPVTTTPVTTAPMIISSPTFAPQPDHASATPFPAPAVSGNLMSINATPAPSIATSAPSITSAPTTAPSPAPTPAATTAARATTMSVPAVNVPVGLANQVNATVNATSINSTSENATTANHARHSPSSVVHDSHDVKSKVNSSTNTQESSSYGKSASGTSKAWTASSMSGYGKAIPKVTSGSAYANANTVTYVDASKAPSYGNSYGRASSAKSVKAFDASKAPSAGNSYDRASSASTMKVADASKAPAAGNSYGRVSSASTTMKVADASKAPSAGTTYGRATATMASGSSSSSSAYAKGPLAPKASAIHATIIPATLPPKKSGDYVTQKTTAASIEDSPASSPQYGKSA